MALVEQTGGTVPTPHRTVSLMTDRRCCTWRKMIALAPSAGIPHLLADVTHLPKERAVVGNLLLCSDALMQIIQEYVLYNHAPLVLRDLGRRYGDTPQTEASHTQYGQIFPLLQFNKQHANRIRPAVTVTKTLN